MFPSQCPTADCLRHCFSNPPQPSCLCSLSTFSPSPRMMFAFPSKFSHSSQSASFSFSGKSPAILLQFCRASDSLLPLQRPSIHLLARKENHPCLGPTFSSSHSPPVPIAVISPSLRHPQSLLPWCWQRQACSLSLSHEPHHRDVSHDHREALDHVQGGMGFSE